MGVFSYLCWTMNTTYTIRWLSCSERRTTSYPPICPHCSPAAQSCRRCLPIPSSSSMVTWKTYHLCVCKWTGNIDSLFTLAWTAEHPYHPNPSLNLNRFSQNLKATIESLGGMQRSLPHCFSVAYANYPGVSHRYGTWAPHKDTFPEIVCEP